MDETQITDNQLPSDVKTLRRLVASLQSQVEQQAHSVIELKNHNDKLESKNVDLQLRVDKLLQQLFDLIFDVVEHPDQ